MSLIVTSQFTYSNEGTSNIAEAFDGTECDVTKFYYSNSALGFFFPIILSLFLCSRAGYVPD